MSKSAVVEHSLSLARRLHSDEIIALPTDLYLSLLGVQQKSLGAVLRRCGLTTKEEQKIGVLVQREAVAQLDALLADSDPSLTAAMATAMRQAAATNPTPKFDEGGNPTLRVM